MTWITSMKGVFIIDKFTLCLNGCGAQLVGTRHYWKTVLCRVPDTLPSAKYRGTRQSNILPSVALGKILHLLVTRQSQPLSKSGLCRVPSTRESQTLGKICFYFFLKNFAECHPWALGKIFFYFLKTNFAECLLGPVLGKDIFAECSPWHSAKYFFFDFGPKFFCVALWQYLKLYSKI